MDEAQQRGQRLGLENLELKQGAEDLAFFNEEHRARIRDLEYRVTRLASENEDLKMAGQAESGPFTPSPTKRVSSVRHSGLASFIQN